MIPFVGHSGRSKTDRKGSLEVQGCGQIEEGGSSQGPRWTLEGVELFCVDYVGDYTAECICQFS